MLQGHVKTTKAEITHFFSAKKWWTWYPTNNCYLLYHFNQSNIEKKQLCVDNKVKEALGDVFFPTCRKENCVYFSTKKTASFYDCKNAKPAATFWIFILRTKNCQLCYLVKMVHFVLQERWVATTKKKIHLDFWRNISANHNQEHPNLNEKRQKLFHLQHNRVDAPLVDTVNQNFIYSFIFYIFSLHKSNKIFSLTNDGFEWSLEFEPDSVTLTVKDHAQEMTISSQEVLLAAWSLLLSQRQDFSSASSSYP